MSTSPRAIALRKMIPFSNLRDPRKRRTSDISYDSDESPLLDIESGGVNIMKRWSKIEMNKLISLNIVWSRLFFHAVTHFET
jgi:hypothetical protein